jgi:hypothetical protein
LVHGEVRGEEYHEGRIRGLAMEFIEELAWFSGFHSSSMNVRAGEIQSLTFQGDNSKSGHN